MTKFYSLIAYDGHNRNDFYLERQLSTHRLSIGWGNENPFDFDSIEDLTKMIRRNTDPQETMHNATNGGESLHLFKALVVGDIVLVRGEAQIVDVVRITGIPFYEANLQLLHYPGYQTYAPFEQLRPGNQIIYPVNQMSSGLHDEFIFEEGRSRVFKEVEMQNAITLLLTIIRRI